MSVSYPPKIQKKGGVPMQRTSALQRHLAITAEILIWPLGVSIGFGAYSFDWLGPEGWDRLYSQIVPGVWANYSCPQTHDGHRMHIAECRSISRLYRLPPRQHSHVGPTWAPVGLATGPQLGSPSNSVPRFHPGPICYSLVQPTLV